MKGWLTADLLNYSVGSFPLTYLWFYRAGKIESMFLRNLILSSALIRGKTMETSLFARTRSSLHNTSPHKALIIQEKHISDDAKEDGDGESKPTLLP
jgi:hypothetical protein